MNAKTATNAVAQTTVGFVVVTLALRAYNTHQARKANVFVPAAGEWHTVTSRRVPQIAK